MGLPKMRLCEKIDMNTIETKHSCLCVIYQTLSQKKYRKIVITSGIIYAIFYAFMSGFVLPPFITGLSYWRISTNFLTIIGMFVVPVLFGITISLLNYAKTIEGCECRKEKSGSVIGVILSTFTCCSPLIILLFGFSASIFLLKYQAVFMLIPVSLFSTIIYYLSVKIYNNEQKALEVKNYE